MELALFLTLPATAAFIFAAEPIIRGVLQHGAFKAVDTVRCAWALSAFSIGLPSYVLVKVLTPGFYARQDTRTPVRLAIYSMGVNLAGNIILIPSLGLIGMGHVGPPLATAVSSTVNVWMLWTALRRRGHFESDRQLRRRAPRMALAALIMGGVLYLLTPYADPYLTRSLVARILALTVLVGGGAAVYGLACFVTGAFAWDDVRTLLRRRRAV